MSDASDVLDSAQFFWNVVKDGIKTPDAGKIVNLLPAGTSVMDITNWQGPVSYPEKYQELSAIFQSDIVDFTVTANWQYNGQYIANFNVIADGTVDVLSSVDVSVTTLAGSMNQDNVAELPYHIDVLFHNVTGGSRSTTFRAVACGDGGGRSLA